MARLKAAPPILRPGPSRFGPAPWTNEAERSAHRREVNPWRKWYDEPEWRRLAAKVKAEALFTCAMCGHIGGRLVADHIKPHKGDRALFMDETNLQCLCKPCHDKHKQAEERRAGW